MDDLVRRDLSRRHPVYNLTHQHLDDIVHRHESRPSPLNHLIRRHIVPVDKRTRLHHQVAHFGQEPG